ncbi:MAG: universal stress protein [Candidatus Sedimenticola sp. 6PFRAG5]
MNSKKNNHPILVPVDFSSCSEAALLKSCELTDCLQQPVIALHVVHDPADMPGYYSKFTKKKDLFRIEDKAQELFDEFIKDIVNRYPRIKQLKKIETMLVIGLPATKILQVAEMKDASMIIMGGKGNRGWKRMLLGSTVDEVARLCSIPLTIVKSDNCSVE